jgi:hypothetical protein
MEWSTVLLGASGVLVSVVSVLTWLFWRVLSRSNQLQKELDEVRFTVARPEGAPSPSSSAEASTPAQTGTPPAISKSLVEAVGSGRAVLYLGSRFGDAVGEAALPEMLRRLLGRIEPPLDASTRASLDLSIERGSLDYAAETVRGRIPDEQLRRLIAEILQVRGDTGRIGKPHALYELLAGLPFSAVLTTLWTTDTEAAYEAAKGGAPLVVTPGSEQLQQLIREDRYFVFHVWGLLAPDQPLLFTTEDREHALRDGSLAARFLSSIVSARPIVFVGATLEEIEIVLGSPQLGSPQRGASSGAEPQRHFALVSSQHLTATWDLLARRLAGRFNVEVLRYVPTPGYPELMEGFTELKRRLPVTVVASEPAEPIRRLTAVRLQNIGPFKSLDLRLNAGWNVILGNNASGKSTILKAIALGLCGDDPKAFEPAARLLRASEANGMIELRVGNEFFQTDLSRELNTVRLKASGLTPLQRGRWVVLGFAPLRGGSLRESKGPSAFGASEPQVADLLPLLSSSVDWRMDDIKQWIVNANAVPNGGTLLNAFFKILRDVNPNETISLKKVEHGTWRVLVSTDDGEVPIEQVSQGMTSTIAWVGTLLQRMYEIYPQSKTPQLEPALVLVDEIDAHLHPAWQRILVRLVSKHFENIQVIATTHSPLVISSMDADNVIIARRDPGARSEISIARASEEVDLSGMRADEILTSTLFGLQTTRSEKDAAMMKRYSFLIGREKRSAQEEKEMSDLRRHMVDWTSRAESPGDRGAAALKEGAWLSGLDEPPRELTDDEQRRVDEGLQRVLSKERGGT